MENGACAPVGMASKRVKLSSVFGHLEMAPPDAIFRVKDAYLADTHPKKVNLGIGGKLLLQLSLYRCTFLLPHDFHERRS